jgi:hypothetical protein
MTRTTATVLLLLAIPSSTLAAETIVPYRSDRAVKPHAPNLGHVSPTSRDRTVIVAPSPYRGYYGSGEQPVVIQRSPYQGYYGD